MYVKTQVVLFVLISFARQRQIMSIADREERALSYGSGESLTSWNGHIAASMLLRALRRECWETAGCPASPAVPEAPRRRSQWKYRVRASQIAVAMC